MREILERELKLQPAGDFELPELPGEPLEPRVFTSTYHDTPAHSLARCGITLRCRVEEGISRWQLKLPRQDARAELEWDGAPDDVPAGITALLTAHLRHGDLRPVAALETRRAGVRVMSGDRALAEVVLDTVEALIDGKPADAFSELEVELVDGDEADLERLADVLIDAGAEPTKGTPKLLRVLEVEDGEPPPSDAAALDHLRFLLLRQLREIDTFDPGVRLGGDAEDVHKLRVATRRARALIRSSHPLVGDRLEALGDELKWLGGALGPARDLDVLLESLRALVGDLGEDAGGGEAIVAELEEERDTAGAAVLEALESRRYLALLTRFARDVDGLCEAEPDVTLADMAHKQAKRLRRAHAKLGKEPDDDSLHALRIKAKRVRYAAELAAQAEGKPMLDLARAARDLQDLVGLNQDAVVAEERIRALAGARSGFAAGRMVELERARRRDVRAELPAVWKRVKRAIRAARVD